MWRPAACFSFRKMLVLMNFKDKKCILLATVTVLKQKTFGLNVHKPPTYIIADLLLLEFMMQKALQVLLRSISDIMAFKYFCAKYFLSEFLVAMARKLVFIFSTNQIVLYSVVTVYRWQGGVIVMQFSLKMDSAWNVLRWNDFQRKKAFFFTHDGLASEIVRSKQCYIYVPIARQDLCICKFIDTQQGWVCKNTFNKNYFLPKKIDDHNSRKNFIWNMRGGYKLSYT